MQLDRMKNHIFNILILIIIVLGVALTYNVSGFMNYVAPYANPGQKGWWNRNGWQRFGYPVYSYWETFQNPIPKSDSPKIIPKSDNILLDFPPDSPSPSDLSLREPYHLLKDELQAPIGKEQLSLVDTQSCYKTDFTKDIEKVGNYRQFTNNYKHSYPDSCSAPFKELVLNFYETK